MVIYTFTNISGRSARGEYRVLAVISICKRLSLAPNLRRFHYQAILFLALIGHWQHSCTSLEARSRFSMSIKFSDIMAVIFCSAKIADAQAWFQHNNYDHKKKQLLSASNLVVLFGQIALNTTSFSFVHISITKRS